MPFDVILISEAEVDLYDIYYYIAHNDYPESAECVVKSIKKVIHSLSSFPNRGVVPREVPPSARNKYREIFFKPYRIVYKVDDERKEVYIFAVADGRRDMEELLKRRLAE